MDHESYAIGPEIVANRLGVGPMGNGYGTDATVSPTPATSNDAVDLKYEEFFLSSWSVGDPSMVVDVPANVPNQYVSNPEQGSEITGPNEPNPLTGSWGNPRQFGDFKPLDGSRPTKAFYAQPNAAPGNPVWR